MRRLMMVLLATTLLAGGCGTDDSDETTMTTARDATTTTTGGTATTEGEGTTTTTVTDEGAGPVGRTSTATVEAGDFPSLEGDTALLVDIRAARHDDFERIVLEFEGDDPPGYRVGYLDPPVRQDGSGNPVELAGDAFLELRVVPAASFDPMSDEARKTYTGSRRFTPEATELIKELVITADFEGHLAWVAGLSERVPFAVEMLDDPLRLVVDVVPAG